MLLKHCCIYFRSGYARKSIVYVERLCNDWFRYDFNFLFKPHVVACGLSIRISMFVCLC